jgi:exodeoxyribonuclease V alpha subunit
MTTIRGELLDFRPFGSDFWGIGKIRPVAGAGELTVAGKLLGAKVGDTVELDGDHAHHAKFGKQFKVTACRVVLPSDASGVVGWLASKLPQVSSRRAEELVERFGVQGLWGVLDRGDASALCVVDGITPKRAGEILAAYQAHKTDRDRFVRFKGWGLTDSQIGHVVDKWGNDAEDRITRNPYALMEHVKGFGWERADAVAMRMGVRRDDPARLCAGLMHAMQLATQAGHCFSPAGKLVGIASSKVCQVSDEHAVRRALDLLVEGNRLARVEQNIYLPRIADAEAQLAESFARRARSGKEGTA